MALVLDPWTGHVSPQFHLVFNDHFKSVPFMEKNEVPPHWAQLAKKLREKVTEEHYELAKTWLFSDAEPGDMFLPEQNPNVSNNSNGTLIGYNMINNDVSKNLLSTGIQPPIHVGLSNDSGAIRTSQNNHFIQCPLLLSVSSSCDLEIPTSQGKDSLLVPHLVNLETMGLRRSPRIAILNGINQDSPAIAAYTSSTTQLKSQQITRLKPMLSFLSVFHSVGA